MKVHKERGRAIINKMVKGGTDAPITAWSEAKLEKAIKRNSVFRDYASELRIARVGGLISDLRSNEKEVPNASMSMALVLEKADTAEEEKEEEGQDDSVPECEADLLLLAAEANSEANLARAAALEQLADNSFDAILITDLAGLIAYSNKAFTKLTGYDQADVIGKSPKLLQGPGTDEKVLARLKESMQNGSGDYEGSAINYRKNGVPFIMHWRVVPVKVCGQIKAWVAIQREGSQIPSEDLSSARFNLDGS
jgi:PAS domain S-box-containing protein